MSKVYLFAGILVMAAMDMVYGLLERCPECGTRAYQKNVKPCWSCFDMKARRG